jgi:hypothetical protein
VALGVELGPLRGLIGTWQGDEGLDVAFSNAKGEVIETPFRERTSFSPFGPVENGQQVLYGLDYRTSAWRPGEEIPFHTEIGYWLWDAATGHIMRCFMVPRGSTVLAGGPAAADATTFTMQAQVGSESYGILSNPYLAGAARTVAYQVTVVVDPAGVYSYLEATTIEHKRHPSLVEHTDRNRLVRVSETV